MSCVTEAGNVNRLRASRKAGSKVTAKHENGLEQLLWAIGERRSRYNLRIGRQKHDLGRHPNRYSNFPNLTAVGSAIVAHNPEVFLETFIREHGLGTTTEQSLETEQDLRGGLQEIRSRRSSIEDEKKLSGSERLASLVRGL
jgi:hypothetical protein